MLITFDTQVKTGKPEKVYCFTTTLGSLIQQYWFTSKIFPYHHQILGSIVVSIPACHAGDRGSIPRRGERFFLILSYLSSVKTNKTKIFFKWRSNLKGNVVHSFLNTVPTCCGSKVQPFIVLATFTKPTMHFVFPHKILHKLLSTIPKCIWKQ